MSGTGKDDLPNWSEFDSVEEPKIEVPSTTEAGSASHAEGHGSLDDSHAIPGLEGIPDDPVYETAPTPEATPNIETKPEPEVAMLSDEVAMLSDEFVTESFEAVPEPLPALDAPESFAIETAAPAEIAPLDVPPTQAEPVEQNFTQAVERPAPTFEEVKSFSETQRPGKLAVPAAYPFSILIEGILEPHAKENLLDLILAENLGIREIDLEPGFESGRLLIPRISEFAATVIVQKLRDSNVKIKVGPSDQIFGESENDITATVSEFQSRNTTSTVAQHPAEKLPVTTQSQISGLNHTQVIDTLVCHARFERDVDTAEIEMLIREMKYKAYRKGAKGLIELKVSITPEMANSQNRVMITAVAIS